VTGVSTEPSPWDVVLIRGAPGIGKSTLGELLRQSPELGAVIDLDEIRGMIAGELFEAHENVHYLEAVGATSRLIKSLLIEDLRPVVVVDVLAHEPLEVMLMGLDATRILIASLYMTDEGLAERMASRHSGYVNLPVAAAVNKEIRLSRHKGELALDVTGLTPYQVKHRIMSRIVASS
jgi:hypothetical protein